MRFSFFVELRNRYDDDGRITRGSIIGRDFGTPQNTKIYNYKKEIPNYLFKEIREIISIKDGATSFCVHKQHPH